jgi:hypothetical protein
LHDDDGVLSSAGRFIGNVLAGVAAEMSSMDSSTGTTFPPMNSSMETSYQRTRSIGSGLRGGHSGRSMGEYMATSDDEDSSSIYQGTRGGHTFLGNQTPMTRGRYHSMTRGSGRGHHHQ